MALQGIESRICVLRLSPSPQLWNTVMVLIVAIFWGMAGDDAGKVGGYLILNCPIWVPEPVRQRCLL